MMTGNGRNGFFYRERFFLVIAVSVALLLAYLAVRPAERADLAGNGIPSEEEIAVAWETGAVPVSARLMLFAVVTVFAALLAVGILLNVRGLVRRNFSADFVGVWVPWGVMPALKIGVYALCALILFQFFEAALASLFPVDYPRRKMFMMIRVALFQNAAVLALITLFFRRSGHSVAYLNLRFDDFITNLKIGLRSYAAFFPVLILATAGAYYLNRRLGVEPSPQPLVSRLLEERGFAVFWLGLIAVLLAPLVEEIFFRGIFYPALKNRIKLGGAMLVSALVFSLIHLEPAGFISIFALGILLAWSYEKSGRLMVPIVIHAVHNALVLLYYLSIIKVSEGIG